MEAAASDEAFLAQNRTRAEFALDRVSVCDRSSLGALARRSSEIGQQSGDPARVALLNLNT
jgi:hypothetical protein